MWRPNSVSAPRDLILAELQGKVPSGSTLAVLAYLMYPNQDPDMLDKKFSITPEAAKSAWNFLRIEEVVTDDGEILTPNPITDQVESPSTEVVSENPTGSSIDLEAVYREMFPDHAFPTQAQWQELRSKSGNDREWLIAIWTGIEDSVLRGKDIKSIPAMTNWFLDNKSKEEVVNAAEAIKRRPRQGQSLVKDVMRKAQAEIAAMPKPTADQKHLDRLQKLKERVGG